MKKISFILVISFLLLSFMASGQYHERDWKWKPYASLTKGGKTFMILYYGTLIDGYNGKVRWRFENRAAKPLFFVDLAKQIYTLENGNKVEQEEKKFKFRRLNPGESAMTLPIVIEKSNFKGLKRVTLKSPEIILDFKTGKKYEWGQLGKVEINVQ